MKEALAFYIFFGLPAWWLAQTLLSLRDYFQRRDEIRRMPPPTEEEKQAVARALAGLPRKEKKSFRWYASHPFAALEHGWHWIPVLILFWPMAILLLKLPPLEVRVSPEALARLNSPLE